MNLQDAFQDFMLSREAKNVTERTLSYYEFTLGRVIEFLESKGVITVDQIQAKHIRLLIRDLRGQELSDSYIHQHARVSKTFLRFCYQERYIPKEIHFDMPNLASRALRVLDAGEIKTLLKNCVSVRDKLIILLLVDTGVRLNELRSLDWADVNMDNGSILVRNGKGNKFRVVGIGIKTQRVILKYKTHIGIQESSSENPLIQTIHGKRFSRMGLRSVLVRLREKSGVDFSAHALRRSFAKLSVKAGMNIVYLQSLMGHAHLETTRDYVQKLDNSEVLNAQKIFGTVDNYL